MSSPKMTGPTKSCTSIGSKRYTPQKHVQFKTLNPGDGPASQVNKFRSHPSAELCLNTDAHYTYCGAGMVRIRCSSSDEQSIKRLLVWITSGICYWPLYIYNFVYFMFWSSSKKHSIQSNKQFCQLMK